MGKNLIQQRRGRGSPTYRSASHHFLGAVKLPSGEMQGNVVDIVHCAGHSAPLMEVAYTNGNTDLAFAPEGIKVGDSLVVGSAVGGSIAMAGAGAGASSAGTGSILLAGSVAALRDIPEGTPIHNIEIHPGDGGKLVRSSGSFAKIVAKGEHDIRVLLPSRKEKVLLPECRAAIGILAGSGRLEKPFLKAGAKYHRMRARNKLYPHVCGISMNAVDHPFGGKCSHIKGRPTQSPRSAPPGRKVGMIAPRRSGRRR